jgi:solute carrier family 25 protein 39/40
MAGSSRQSLPSWITAAAATTTTTRVDIEGINKEGGPKNEESKSVPSASDFDLGFVERAFAAAGAAVLSAVIVNPLDVAKVTNSLTFFTLISQSPLVFSNTHSLSLFCLIN